MVRVERDLLVRVQQVLSYVGMVEAGKWPEVDALKLEVQLAIEKSQVEEGAAEAIREFYEKQKNEP